ncbi:DUF6643 family protein [Streptomyces sp. ICBB 8177]|uniref:DUF6643 family protein n=1 Tax=Streptomyces sp. ICBB 8177 TaxID=563922 RepID=UPI000D673C31|nr:DUF6643 family protein [Streptomyces sp. ICBB 8177]PWI41750.1 hypothetical protein CK485_23220 [Streptomyces sp. ICBB 8177]
MTTPRGTYGGGYYASSAFPDTPIYDSLVAERGTPQIAPIRVPSPYDTGSSLPALPALPALPSGPSHHTPHQGTYTGQLPSAYPAAAYPAQSAPAAAYIPQQASAPRGYANGYPPPGQAPYQGGGTGYEAARPVPPRPVPPRQAVPPRQPAPGTYQGYGDDPYRRPYQGQGY